MRVLFIGGTGNISEACVARLCAGGHEVTVLTRGRGKVQQGCRAVRADRKNLSEMRSALEGLSPEVVVNFLGYEVQELAIDYELFHGRIQQYVFISSATVYAKPPRHLPITEEGPFGNPWWEYAQKKLECELWLEERWKEDGFPITIVRPSHTYSHRWIPNPISSSSYTFAARLERGRPVYVHDDGETPWTLTASSDFAVGLCGLLGRNDVLGEAFHITADEVLTWNEIYGQIASALGASNVAIEKIPTDFICQVAPRFTGTLKGDKAWPGVFDNSKIKRYVPEFKPSKLFAQGVRESVAWLKANPEQQNLSPELDTLVDRVIAAWRTRST